jgi:hypothetical protein
MSNLVYSTELITKLDAKSAKRLWRALVVKDNETYYTQQEFWSVKQDGTESKHTFSALTKIDRKNIGKNNETTEEEQAIKEAIVLYNKKLDAVLDEDNFSCFVEKYRELTFYVYRDISYYLQQVESLY